MTTTRAFLAVLTLVTLLPLGATPSVAQTATCRPWCVFYGGRNGGTNCGFISREQCMWTAQGSDVCMPNGSCPPSAGASGNPAGYDTSGRGERRRR